MKALQLSVIILAIFGEEVHAAHYIFARVTSIEVPSDVYVTLDVYLNGDTVNMLTIWDSSNNTYTCRTDGGQPNDIFFDGSITDPSFKRVLIKLTPTTFINGNSQDAGCPFNYPVSGKYEFYVRTFVVSPESLTPGTDREFLISLDVEIGVVQFVGSTTFTFFDNPIPLTADVIAQSLQVVNAGTNAIQTTMDIGTSGKLKFTLTVQPYQERLSVAGAVVHSCIVDRDNTFTDPVTFIGADGCAVETSILRPVTTDTGFSKHASSAQVDTVKTFVAYSHPFVIARFRETNILSQSSGLFFKCGATFCYDDTTTVNGTCGGNHCDPSSRRRREVTGHHIVTGRINLTTQESGPLDDREDRGGVCIKTIDTWLYQTVVGSLSTLAVIGLCTMIYTYHHVSSILAQPQTHNKLLTQ